MEKLLEAIKKFIEKSKPDFIKIGDVTIHLLENGINDLYLENFSGGKSMNVKSRKPGPNHVSLVKKTDLLFDLKNKNFIENEVAWNLLLELNSRYR